MRKTPLIKVITLSSSTIPKLTAISGVDPSACKDAMDPSPHLYELGVGWEQEKVLLIAKLEEWEPRTDRKPGKELLNRGLSRLVKALAVNRVRSSVELCRFDVAAPKSMPQQRHAAACRDERGLKIERCYVLHKSDRVLGQNRGEHRTLPPRITAFLEET